MHAALAASLLTALAAAAPAPASPVDTRATYENIDVSDFTVRQDQNPNSTYIHSVSFHLDGDDATDLLCSGSEDELDAVVTCGESKYRFWLDADATEGTAYSLRLYHELGVAYGTTGQGLVPTYCRAGGNGPQDYVCVQVSPTTIVIDDV